MFFDGMFKVSARLISAGWHILYIIMIILWNDYDTTCRKRVKSSRTQSRIDAVLFNVQQPLEYRIQSSKEY